MRVTNASGELVEVSADAVGLIGCSLGASSLLQLLALSKDTRKQRKAMLALVSHFKTSFRAPFPTNAARHAVRVDPEREMPLVEKTMRAYSDMTALHAAAHDMNVGKGALCWMLSEFIRAVDWKTLQQRVILAGDFKCLEDMIDTYFERTASTMAFGTVTHPSMVFGAPSPGFIEAIPYALVQQGAASVTVLKVLMDAQLRMLAKKYPRANVLSPTGTATVFHLHSESMMSGDVAMVQGNARFGYLTPLMLACRKGDLESVELMLTGRTTAVPGMDRTIALRACPDDEIDLDDVPRPPDASNCEGYTHAHGMTALMSTAKYGTIECMRLLLKRGVDVNKKEPSDHSRQGRFWGLTATGYACQEGRADCLQLLLDHGGAVDASKTVVLAMVDSTQYLEKKGNWEAFLNKAAYCRKTKRALYLWLGVPSSDILDARHAAPWATCRDRREGNTLNGVKTLGFLALFEGPQPPDSVLYVDADAWFSDVAFSSEQVTPEAYLALSDSELLGNQNRIGGPKIPMNGGLIFARKSQFTSQFFALWWRGRCGKKDQLPLWATLFASWSAASDGAYDFDSSLFDRYAVAHNKRGALHVLQRDAARIRAQSGITSFDGGNFRETGRLLEKPLALPHAGAACHVGEAVAQVSGFTQRRLFDGAAEAVFGGLGLLLLRSGSVRACCFLNSVCTFRGLNLHEFVSVVDIL